MKLSWTRFSPDGKRWFSGLTIKTKPHQAYALGVYYGDGSIGFCLFNWLFARKFLGRAW